MAGSNAHYLFRGIAKWAKVHTPDPKYNNYSIDLYLDKNSLKKFKESGLQLDLRDSDEGTFVKFRRPKTKLRKDKAIEMGPPTLFIGDALEPFNGNIGNGSHVVCKVRVYDTMKGKGHELESIHVLDLVPYDDEVVLPDDDVLPF